MEKIDVMSAVNVIADAVSAWDGRRCTVDTMFIDTNTIVLSYVHNPDFGSPCKDEAQYAIPMLKFAARHIADTINDKDGCHNRWHSDDTCSFRNFSRCPSEDDWSRICICIIRGN